MRKKKCVRCGKVQELVEFAINGTSHQSYCRGCKGRLNKRYRKINIRSRIKHHFSTRITKQLGDNLPPNLTRNLELYVGYKFGALRRYLNEQIKQAEGINIKEAIRRGYHIDHIKPLSSFNVISVNSQEFRDCWAIENLKLIPAEENLKKGTQYV